MVNREGPDDTGVPPGSQWRQAGVVAREVQCAVGFRKRRTAPGVELGTEAVRVQFLCRSLEEFFNGRAESLETSGKDRQLFYLYRVGKVLPIGSEDQLSGLPLGSVTLLAASPGLLTPVLVLSPEAAADFGRWFRTLSQTDSR